MYTEFRILQLIWEQGSESQPSVFKSSYKLYGLYTIRHSATPALLFSKQLILWPRCGTEGAPGPKNQNKEMNGPRCGTAPGCVYDLLTKISIYFTIRQKYGMHSSLNRMSIIWVKQFRRGKERICELDSAYKSTETDCTKLGSSVICISIARVEQVEQVKSGQANIYPSGVAPPAPPGLFRYL